MKKTYLLTPGPTAIPESVSAVFAQPIIHHRTPEFERLFAEARAGLQVLFQTKQDVLMLACTGTGVMDAAVANVFSRGDTVVVVNGGKFGERWTQIAKAYGLRPVEIKLPWGHSVDPAELERVLARTPEARAVLFQASETSTGARMPTREICAVAKKAGVLTVCDAITACGVFDLQMDAWGIDVMMTGSQKALMLPPGLAMIALSERAWEASAKSDLPKFYFNLAKERKVVGANQTAWTPAISLIQGLQVSLRLILGEDRQGLPALFRKYEMLARATRAGAQVLGLELLAQTDPSPAVSSVLLPPAIIQAGLGKKVVKIMSEKYGVTIVGGQDEYEGKLLRLSHFGYCDKFDITTGLAALELTLHGLGHPVQFGAAVGAALEVFSANSSEEKSQ